MTSVESLKQVSGHLLSPVSKREIYEQDLVTLTAIVQETSQSDVARVKLARHIKFIDTVTQVLESHHLLYATDPLQTLYLRVFRGFLLCIRNVVMKSTELENSLICFNLSQFVNNDMYGSHELLALMVVVYAEILANNVGAKDNDGHHLLSVLLSLVGIKQIQSLDDKQLFLVLVYAQRCLQNEGSVSLLLTDEQYAPIMWYLVAQLDRVPDSSANERVLVNIFQLIVSHESYSAFLQREFTGGEDEAKLLEVLKASRLIVTSSDEWDNYQVAAILAWLFEYFKAYADESMALLSSKNPKPNSERLLFVHSILVVVLDSMADLGKLNSARQFFQHYNAIDKLVPLLGVVHREVERKTLKSKSNKINEVSDKEFPEVKNFIIELITYLAHESFETQEKVRKLHGLEVVLSSCIIDDNNPYVKERAIVCLKTLLFNNPGNQKVVAQLEAQGTADDSALREAGYEVEVVDGKVQVKKQVQQV